MKEQLYDILHEVILNKNNYSGLGYPAIIQEICNNNNLIFEIDSDYNGWEVDWWTEILTPEGEHHCDINGSMYYGTINIKF